MYEAYRQVYDALGAKNIDLLLKPVDNPVQPLDPAQENIRAMDMKQLQAFVGQDHDAHIAAHMAFMRTRMIQINPVIYSLLQRHIAQHIGLKARMMAQAQFDQIPEMQALAQSNPQEAALQFETMVAKITAQLTQEAAMTEENYLAQRKDPLTRLKERELDLKAMDQQRKLSETTLKEQNEDFRFDEKIELEKMKMENKQEADKARLAVSLMKLEKK